MAYLPSCFKPFSRLVSKSRQQGISNAEVPGIEAVVLRAPVPLSIEIKKEM